MSEQESTEAMDFKRHPALGEVLSSLGGTLPCKTSDIFSANAKTVVSMGVANPSNKYSVDYAFYHLDTGEKVFWGTLPPGNTNGKQIPLSSVPKTYRVQNQSSCQESGAIPALLWSASIEQF